MPDLVHLDYAYSYDICAKCMNDAIGLRVTVHNRYLVIVMNTLNGRIARSGVAVGEERTLRVMPEVAEVRAARIIASLRDDTAPAGCQGQSPARSGSRALRILPAAGRQQATS